MLMLPCFTFVIPRSESDGFSVIYIQCERDMKYAGYSIRNFLLLLVRLLDQYSIDLRRELVSVSKR